jgi:hypothetical protein
MKSQYINTQSANAGPLLDGKNFPAYQDYIKFRLSAFGDAGKEVISEKKIDWDSKKPVTPQFVEERKSVTLNGTTTIEVVQTAFLAHPTAKVDLQNQSTFHLRRVESYRVDAGNLFRYLIDSLDKPIYDRLNPIDIAAMQESATPALDLWLYIKTLVKKSEGYNDLGLKDKEIWQKFKQVDRLGNSMPMFMFIHQSKALLQKLVSKDCNPKEAELVQRFLDNVDQIKYSSVLQGISFDGLTRTHAQLETQFQKLDDDLPLVILIINHLH